MIVFCTGCILAIAMSYAVVRSASSPQATGGNIPAMKELGPEFDALFQEIEALGYVLDLDVYRSLNFASPHWSATVRIGQDSTGAHIALSADGTTAREAVEALKVAIRAREE